jgi:HEAT repeat protein
MTSGSDLKVGSWTHRLTSSRAGRLSVAAANLLLTGGSDVTVEVPGKLDTPVSISPDTRVLEEIRHLIDILRANERQPSNASKEYIQQLIEALGSRSFQERDEASKKLEAIGPWVRSDLEMALQDRDLERVRRAEDILDSIRINEERRGMVLVVAANRLLDFGPAARSAVSVLIDLLKDEIPTVRHTAANTLACMGADSKPAVPALIDLLTDGSASMSEEAAVTLGRIGPEARAAVPALIDVVRDGGYRCKEAAVIALGRIGPEANAAVPALIDVLNDTNRDTFVRKATVIALGRIGQEAKAAVPGLIALLRMPIPT